MPENNKDSTENMAEDRTNWAEDRTLLANERTFSSRMGFALGSLGVALGLQGVFSAVTPTWIAKSVAIIFIALAIYIAHFAYRSTRKMHDRLHAHNAEPAGKPELLIVTWLVTFGALGIAIVLWIS